MVVVEIVIHAITACCLPYRIPYTIIIIVFVSMHVFAFSRIIHSSILNCYDNLSLTILRRNTAVIMTLLYWLTALWL